MNRRNADKYETLRKGYQVNTDEIEELSGNTRDSVDFLCTWIYISSGNFKKLELHKCLEGNNRQNEYKMHGNPSPAIGTVKKSVSGSASQATTRDAR